MKSLIIFALCLAVTQGYSVRGRVPEQTAVQAGGRIFYAYYAENGQFPYAVYLSVGCGGSLISDKWVLSAAACYAKIAELRGVTAYLGNVNWTDPSVVIVNVAQYYNHPLWDGTDYGYDISLLELENSVTFSDNIQPIRIPSSRDELFEGELAVVSGFGHTEYANQFPLLKYVNQRVLTHAECIELGIQSSENLLCTKGPSDVQSPCSGDIGGPLIVKRPEGDLLIGIVSFGPCISNSPTRYVKPHSFLEWIRDTTGLDV